MREAIHSVGSKIQACASLRSVFEPISVRPLRWALSSSANSNHTMLAALPRRSGRDARIFVKSLTGRKIFVTVALEGSAFRLKQLLETTESVPVDDIRLVYSAKQLADDKPLEFYNIQDGGTIHMVLGLGRRIQPLCATFAPCINPFVASDGRPVPDLPRLGWSYKQTCGDLLPLRKHTAGRDGRTSLSIGNAVEVVCRDGTGRALWCRTIVREVHGSRVLVDLGEEDIHEAIRQRKAEEDHRALVALRATEAKAARGADIFEREATPTLQVVENDDLVRNVAEFLDEDGSNRALVCWAWRHEIRTVRWRRAEDRRRALQRCREVDASRLAEAKFARDQEVLARRALAYANYAGAARAARDAALSRCDCAERRAQQLRSQLSAESLAHFQAQRKLDEADGRVVRAERSAKRLRKRLKRAQGDAAASVAAAAAEVLRPRCSGIDAMSVRGLSDAALDQLLADAHAAQSVLARELRARLDAERDKHLCVVCLTRPKEYAPSACGHFALCEACMPRVDSCPICRIPTDPEDWDRVYA